MEAKHPKQVDTAAALASGSATRPWARALPPRQRPQPLRSHPPAVRWPSQGYGSAPRPAHRYENRLCKLTLRAGDAPPLTGLAYNERYLGTLW